jgi:2-keto-4-pentenoate hydratase/2-oxohepta-3-ene-1,7-dioic acid hydratase in catechol pathway
MGPWLIPASDVNPTDLSIQLWLNDEKMQDSRTSNMIFKIPDIIKYLSEGFTLLPGDIILTGTPDGVGFARKPPVLLKRGDNMKIMIEGLGCLENHVE